MTKNFDFIVYGATLEGLLIAEYLVSHGVGVVVLEPSQKPQLGLFNVYKNMDAAAASAQNIEAALKKFDFKYFNFKSQFLTFDKGNFEPFVGFGENAPLNSELFSEFLNENRLEIETTHDDLITRFSKLDIRYSLDLTSIEFENEKIKSLTLNDSMIYQAENYIFSCNPVEIIDLFDHKVVSQKFLQKLGRAEMPSTLLFNVKHKELGPAKHHVLYGTTKNPTVCVGLTVQQDSLWITFLPSESIDFNEDGVTALKEMKRQIKRALPEELSDVTSEKISFFSKSHGHIDLKMEAFGKIQGLENLCLCTHFLIPGVNPVVKSLVAAHETRLLIENFIEASLDQLENQEISKANA